MENIPNQSEEGADQERRGRMREELVFSAFNQMPRPEDLPDWFTAIERASPHSEMDTKGIDFIIYTQGIGHSELRVQIKSSDQARKAFLETHSGIGCAVISGDKNESSKKIREKVLKAALNSQNLPFALLKGKK